jgi:hypothetical protein
MRYRLGPFAQTSCSTAFRLQDKHPVVRVEVVSHASIMNMEGVHQF